MPDEPSLRSLQNCPICGSLDIADEYSRPDQDLGTLRLMRCHVCGIVFLNPRLSHDAIVELENTSPVYSVNEEYVDATVSELERMIDLLGSYASDHEHLLDIGCNRGFLLEAARRRGWTPLGVEISPVAVAEAERLFSGLTIHTGELASLPRNRSFDLITCWHVLEHTTDPIALLEDILRRLSNHGVLAIQVPSYTFFNEFISSGREVSLVCSVHNFYFTESSLRSILIRCGFDIVASIEQRDDLMLTVIARPSTRMSQVLRRAISRVFPWPFST